MMNSASLCSRFTVNIYFDGFCHGMCHLSSPTFSSFIMLVLSPSYMQLDLLCNAQGSQPVLKARRPMLNRDTSPHTNLTGAVFEEDELGSDTLEA
jgi:hypothetical protein